MLPIEIKNMTREKVIIITILSIGLVFSYYHFAFTHYSDTKVYHSSDILEGDIEKTNVETDNFPITKVNNNFNENKAIENSNNGEIKIDINENWCSASKDLAEHDYSLLSESIKEWNYRIGKASADREGAIYHDDGFYPDNYTLAPYQEMELDELEKEAERGDQWAMVAFVQLANFDKNQKIIYFANELLLKGAVHHSLEYLVKAELTAAKSNFRKKDIDSATANIINAIAYSMLGLKEYSEGGLLAYLGITTRNEIFKDILKPSVILKDKHNLVNDRYDELIRSLSEERDKRSIFLEPAPDLIKKSFTTNLAAASLNSARELEFLNALGVNEVLSKIDSPCFKRLTRTMQ